MKTGVVREIRGQRREVEMDSFGAIEELDFFSLKIDLYISRLECAGRRTGDCRGRHASAEIGRQMLNQTICWGARAGRAQGAGTRTHDCVRLRGRKKKREPADKPGSVRAPWMPGQSFI